MKFRWNESLAEKRLRAKQVSRFNGPLIAAMSVFMFCLTLGKAQTVFELLGGIAMSLILFASGVSSWRWGHRP